VDLAATDLLDRLIASTDDALIAADSRGRLIGFNTAAGELLGYTEAEAKGGVHAADLYADPRDARRLSKLLMDNDPEPVTEERVRLRTHYGEAVATRFIGWVVRDAQGEVVGTAGLFRDMRHYRAMANQIEAFTDRVLAQEQATTTKMVAGGAAHELNQPLTSVMGTLELLLLKRGLDPSTVERLERSYAQLERMAETVRRLSEVRELNAKPYVDDTTIMDLKGDT